MKRYEDCKTLTELKEWALQKCSLTGDAREKCRIQFKIISAQRPECIERNCIVPNSDEKEQEEK